MKNNIGKLFYKEYYEGLKYGYVFDSNKKTELENDINERIKSSDLVKIENRACQNVFSATILYPGLVTGTGLVHDSKNIEGGYNLGLHFDYTWGMPVVYGSSVKGVLRQYFEEFFLEEKDCRKGDVKPLCKAIFEGEGRSIYERDIFFDAVITGEYDGRILEDDSITPHKDEPLKDPVPITMLKIAPGCKIEFRFRLHDSEINENTYTAEFKEKLFKKILGAVGVGAKTNVGYGQLRFD